MSSDKMTPDAKRLLIFFGSFSLLLIFFMITRYLDDRKEYYFIITKIEVSEKGQLRIFNKEKEVSLSGYSIYKTWDIKVGDSLSKPKFAEYLRIYRKDSITGEYVEKSKIHRR